MAHLYADGIGRPRGRTLDCDPSADPIAVMALRHRRGTTGRTPFDLVRFLQ
jgi:hypothetical protein